jgi:hypothetical protein
MQSTKRRSIHPLAKASSGGILGLLLTFNIGLPTGALRVEDEWMKIDLTCAVRNHCNATRSPIRLHHVTMPAERLQQVIERHPGDVDGEIKVAVDRGLTPNQRVDPPPAGNPDAVKPCRVSDTQHSPATGSRHAGVGVRYRPARRPSTSTALTAEIRMLAKSQIYPAAAKALVRRPLDASCIHRKASQ